MATLLRGIVLRGGSAGVVAFALVRCVYAPTEMVLDVRTDLDCAADRPQTQIRVGTEIVAETSACTASADGRSVVGTLTFVPSGDRDARATLEVIVAARGTNVADCASQPGNCISARRSFSYVAHESRRLPIDLQRACLGKICDASQTCFDGACIQTAVACEGASCDVPENLPSRRPQREGGSGLFDGGGTSGVVGQPCKAGETKCDGALLFTCGAEGFVEADRCATAKLCERQKDGKCGPQLCAAGEVKKCVGRTLYTCSEDGTELITPTECPQGSTCEDGACVVRATCTPGARTCDFGCAITPEQDSTDDCVIKCNPLGTSWSFVENCGYAQMSSGDSQTCYENVPGQAFCGG